jgi:hypothetical protein
MHPVVEIVGLDGLPLFKSHGRRPPLQGRR